MQGDVEPRKKSSVALLTDQSWRTSSQMALCTHLVPVNIALRRSRSMLVHEMIESTTSALSPASESTRQSENTRSAWKLAQQASSLASFPNFSALAAHFCVTWTIVKTVCSPAVFALAGRVQRKSSISRLYALESTSPSSFCFRAQSIGDGMFFNNRVRPELDYSRFRFLRMASIICVTLNSA